MDICLYYMKPGILECHFLSLRADKILSLAALQPATRTHSKFKSRVEMFFHSQTDYPIPNFMAGDQPTSGG